MSRTFIVTTRTVVEKQYKVVAPTAEAAVKVPITSLEENWPSVVTESKTWIANVTRNKTPWKRMASYAALAWICASCAVPPRYLPVSVRQAPASILPPRPTVQSVASRASFAALVVITNATKTVAFSWTAGSGGDGYRMYWGTNSLPVMWSTNLPNVTAFTLTFPYVKRTRYAFAVSTTSSTSGLESALSASVFWPLTSPPPNKVEISWGQVRTVTVEVATNLLSPKWQTATNLTGSNVVLDLVGLQRWFRTRVSALPALTNYARTFFQ